MGKKRILYIDTVGEKREEQEAIKEYLNQHLSDDCAPIEVTSLG